jgi:hypothetical protein
MVDDMGGRSVGTTTSKAGRVVLSSFSVVGFVLALATTPLADRDHRSSVAARPIGVAVPTAPPDVALPPIEPVLVEAPPAPEPVPAPVAAAEPPPAAPAPEPEPAPPAPETVLVAAAPEPVLLAVAPAPARSQGLLGGQITTASAPGQSTPLGVVEAVVAPVVASPLQPLRLLGGR